eukprot:975315-Rhodomonas_salina.1
MSASGYLDPRKKECSIYRKRERELKRLGPGPRSVGSVPKSVYAKQSVQAGKGEIRWRRRASRLRLQSTLRHHARRIVMTFSLNSEL